MSMSGLVCSDEVVNTYQDQKLRKTADYIMYKIADDKKSIEIAEQGKGDWKTFVEKLPPQQCRYASVDFAYNNKSKLIFVAWCPDTAPVREKMIFASSKDVIKKKLEGVACEVQCTDNGDLLYDEVKEKVQKTDY